ncbi:MAG TPA: TauD/TfdA family dioxygenase [Pyrinomonadaceae bacterium]|jgi:alpha-ketoglutarate-dependent taurine dioxygenase
MFQTSSNGDRKLPLIVETEKNNRENPPLCESLLNSREIFGEELLKYGAVLFRGFGVETVAEFQSFARRFAGTELLDYAGGVSPRISLNDGVYTSTEYPPNLTLSLHNELSYSDVYPNRLYFFCFTEPDSGGETTVADSRDILSKIDSEVVDVFKRKKIRYDRNLSAGKGSGYSWQDAFETDDKETVENLCRKIGAEFEWKADGGLRLSQIRPATTIHPVTGEEVWFNQADGFHPSNLDAETYELMKGNFRLNACFGDGSPFDAAMLEHIREVLRSETIPVKWQRGDILVLDNILAAHGRMPFSGKRKIVLAMS